MFVDLRIHMATYILTLAEQLREAVKSRDARKVFSQTKIIRDELEHLNACDFDPAVQPRFAEIRHELKRWSERSMIKDWSKLLQHAEDLVQVLPHYKGAGSSGSMRVFRFVHDSKLRTIIERDFEELHLRLYPGKAWKDAVILAGSILEAILYDRLTSNPTREANSKASPKAPKGKLIEDWTLEKMILVAEDIGLLVPDKTAVIDKSLRHYRNFVHPRREIKEQYACGEPEATIAKGALEAVCNYFDANP